MYTQSILISLLSVLFFAQLSAAIDISMFSMPDNSYETLNTFLMNTEQSLYVAAYTITSKDIASALSYMLSKNINITMLVDKSPVGGIPKAEINITCMLSKQGARILLYDKPLRYHHAKYIVRDRKDVLVSTDNFVYDSYPPFIHSGFEYNRGWGVIVYDDNISQSFVDIFEKDMSSSVGALCPGNMYTTTTATTIISLSAGKRKQSVSEATPIFAPDNAKESILAIINATKELLYIEQLYIYKNWSATINPFLAKAIEKAENGVDVRILLDGSYGSAEKNNETIQYIRSLNISSLQARHSKMPPHVKGVVSDDAVIISSVNWNENSVLNNREAGIIIKGNSGYYKELFLRDWAESGIVTGLAIELSSYTLELVFISLGVVIVLVFLLKNNAFR